MDEKKMTNVLVRRCAGSSCVIAVSDDIEKMKSRMKEEIESNLIGMFGEREKIDPDEDRYVFDLWESLDNLEGKYWSDEDDECGVSFEITEAEVI